MGQEQDGAYRVHPQGEEREPASKADSGKVRNQAREGQTETRVQSETPPGAIRRRGSACRGSREDRCSGHHPRAVNGWKLGAQLVVLNLCLNCLWKKINFF